MKRRIISNIKTPIYNITESIVEITINKKELEEIKSILGIRTDNLRREHKGKILKYILKKYMCTDIFKDYGIYFTSLKEDVTFTYNALIQENFTKPEFDFLKREIDKRSK